MKTFKQLVSEVAQPLSQGEKNFKNLDNGNAIDQKKMAPGILDQDHIFKGEPIKKDTSKKISYHDGEDVAVYDKTLKREEVEQDQSVLEENIKIADIKGITLVGSHKSKKGEHFDLYHSKHEGQDVHLLAHRDTDTVHHMFAGASTKSVQGYLKKQGFEHLPRPVKEDAEQIDELSRKTLATYVRRAMSDKADKLANAKVYARIGGDAKAVGDQEFAMHNFQKSGEYLGKVGKRSQGINTALNKLAKEEVEQIDELSKKTLKSYVDKAGKSSYEAAKAAGTAKLKAMRKAGKDTYMEPTMDFDNPTSAKRRQGVHRALDKMYKEEVELDEAKRGRPRKNPLPAGKTADDDGGREHIVMQLRKVVSLRGEKHVEFNDSSKHKLSVDHAKKALEMHDGMKRAEDKLAFASRLAKSHDSFHAAIQGKPAEKPKSKVTLAGRGLHKEEVELEEGKWNYPKEITKTKEISDMGNTNAAKNRLARKLIRKKAKADAHKKLMTKEEVEQIDELSTGLIARYMSKRGKQINSASKKAEASRERADAAQYYSSRPNRVAKHNLDMAKKHDAFVYDKSKHYDRAGAKVGAIDNWRHDEAKIKATGKPLSKYRKWQLGDWMKESVDLTEWHASYYKKRGVAYRASDAPQERPEPKSDRKEGESHSDYMDRVAKEMGAAWKKKREGIKESVEPIEELSKKTLSSYVNKASRSAVRNAIDYAKGYSKPAHARTDAVLTKADAHHDKATTRLQGIAKATEKLAKEEADPHTVASDRGAMTTYVKIGPDGRPEIVKKRMPRKEIKIEQKLLDLYDTLSEENKAVFDQILESEDGLEKLTKFAEEMI